MTAGHTCAYYAWNGKTGMAVVRPGGILHVSVSGAPGVVTRVEPDLGEDDLLDLADGVFREMTGGATAIR
jgi:hypothetical protein